jgi:hypothetical protein
MERTVPNSENISRTLSSDASVDKLPTNIFFNGVSLPVGAGSPEIRASVFESFPLLSLINSAEKKFFLLAVT